MWMFITVFTTAYMSLSRAISAQYTLSFPVSLSYILILFFNLRLRVSSVPFLSDFPTLYLLHVRICLLLPFCVCVYLFFSVFLLYSNLTNCDSELHLKLRFFVLYVFTFLRGRGCYPSRSPAYT